MKENACVRAEYMFGLLDGQTYNLYCGHEWLGQINVNHADRSATLALQDMQHDSHRLKEVGSYPDWRRWLRVHAVPT
jgi:hypothetical protein